jgi:hypothetical protein
MLSLPIRVGGDESQERGVVPIDLEHPGVVGHRVVDVEFQRRVEIRDPTSAPGNLPGGGEGQGRPAVFPDDPAVPVVECRDLGEPSFRFSLVGPQFDAMLPPLPVFPGFRAEAGTVAALGVGAEVTVAAGHGG